MVVKNKMNTQSKNKRLRNLLFSMCNFKNLKGNDILRCTKCLVE